MEGIYLRVDEGGFLKYRAKIVRHDFIQNIEDGGRWEKKQKVFQRCNKDEWGYFNVALCNGTTQTMHGPPELDPDYVIPTIYCGQEQ